MRPENDTIRRKRDLEFQSRVLAAVEKPKESRLWALLNKPFMLWILSLILLTVGGSYFTAYRQCEQDAYAQIDQFTKLKHELIARENHIRQIVVDNPTVAAMRDKLLSPNYYFYPEYKDYPVEAIREAYNESAQKIMDHGHFDRRPPLPASDQKFVRVMDGEIPASVTDADIPALRKFALSSAAIRMPENDYVWLPRSFDGPVCVPFQLFERSILGNPVPIVREFEF
jgi:hypothetical protein